MSAVVFDTASSGHIDVIYTSLNPGQTIDATTVSDDQPEFSLDGPAVNLVVNGHATQLDSRTFRYSFTGNLVTGLLDNSVNVQFIAGSVSDTAGAGLAAGTQTFGIFFAPPTGPPPPTNILLSPSASAVVNASTLAARGYIDVKFVASQAIDDASINGDEISLTASTDPNTLSSSRTCSSTFRSSATRRGATS